MKTKCEPPQRVPNVSRQFSVSAESLEGGARYSRSATTSPEADLTDKIPIQGHSRKSLLFCEVFI